MNCSIELYKENHLFKLYSVKFKDLNYMFWVPKNSLNSREVNVYFDNNITSFQEGTIGVSLNGISDIQDLKTALEILIQIMASYSVNDITFKFISHNDKQQALITILEQVMGISKDDGQVSNKSFSVKNGRIFDGDKFIGVVGQNGYDINCENNSICQNGKFVAWIGDNIKQQGTSKFVTKSYRPSYLQEARPSNLSTEPSGPIGEKRQLGRAAFVNLPVIMFILSALLLIGSVILLFILD